MKKRNIFIVGGVAVLVIILGLVGFFVVGPLITSARSQAQSPAPTVTASPSTTTAKKNPFTPVLKPHAADIQSQVAQGLNLSVSQLQTDIKAGQTLTQIAAAQKVSSTQLQTLVTNAVKPYLDQAISAGTLTQQQENSFLKRLQKNPDLIDNLLKLKTA